MEESKGDRGGGGDEGEREGKREETFSQWLEYHQNEVTSIADILKDELNTIARRKMDRNEAIVREERKPAIERLGKSIVISFNDAISKAIRHLQSSSIIMAKELQDRFKLPDDWMEQTGTDSKWDVDSIVKMEVAEKTVKPAKQKDAEEVAKPTKQKDAEEAVKPAKHQDAEEMVKPAKHKDAEESVKPGKQKDTEESVKPANQKHAEVKPAKQKEAEEGVKSTTQVDAEEAVIPTTQEDAEEAVIPTTQEDAEEAVIPTTQEDAEEAVILTAQEDAVEAVILTAQEDAVEAVILTTLEDVEEMVIPATQEDAEEMVIPATQEHAEETVIPTTQEDAEETVITTTQEDAEEAVKPAKHNGTEESVKPAKHNGTEESVKPAKHNGTEESVKPAKHRGAEESVKPAKHRGAEESVKPAKHRGAKEMVKPAKQKDAEETVKLAKQENKKTSKEERDAMKAVLETSDSESEPEKNINEKPRNVRKQRNEKTHKISSAVGEFQDKDNDPKLKVKPKVLVERLAATVEKTLANQGYVTLKDYHKMKKCRFDLLEKMDDSDSDSSIASDDSLAQLEKAVKLMTRNSIISTMKYKKKTTGSVRGRKVRTSKANSKSNFKDQSDDSDSDSDNSDESDVFESKNGRSSSYRNKIYDDTVDIASCSESDDLEPGAGSDKNEKKNNKQQSNKSRPTDGKRKKYVNATISSSDSDADKKAVLGSSDSDVDRKNKRGKGSDTSDTEIIPRTRKRVTRKKKTSSGSEASIIDIGSDTDSDDSDFKDSRKRQRDSSPENKRTKKKKRRRIVNDSDASDRNESNDSDIEEIPQDEQEAGSSQRGRKKIRKIISKSELSKTTKEAEKEEEERRKRLLDKQKLFNGIHKAPESDKIKRLVLDVDPETKEPAVEVDPAIVSKLKPHQAEGVKFLYNACFESLDMIKQGKTPGGCILAHCMGLGKTLQSVAFIHSLLSNSACGIKTALIICPLSTVNNWFNEFKNWTEDADYTIRIHKLFEAKKSGNSRADYLRTWSKRGGVGILHYDMFRRLADPKGKAKMKSDLRNTIKHTLLDPGPDIVICDEGHLLKNCKSMLSLAVNNIGTRRRIVLTGTPLQNNLVEYHTMMNFVKPNLLGSLQEFTNRFVNPIKNGQHADSTDFDVKIMKRRAHVLHRKLEGCVQRCDYSILSPYLPPKYEYIINIKLSDKQEELYKYYLENVVDGDLVTRKRSLLKYYAELVKVWSHPIALTMSRAKNDDDDETTESEGGSLKDFIVDGSEESSSSEHESGDSNSNGGGKKQATSRKTRAQAVNDPDPPNQNGDVTEIEKFGSKSCWWNSIFKTKSEMYGVELSGKLIILQQILKTCESIGDKVLVFSQFLSSLDIIEEFLADWDKDKEEEEKQKGGPITFPLGQNTSSGRWRRNHEYFRIDGQTKVSDRHRDCERFNKKSLTRAKLFLISTRAGGLGINLYGANRVVIFDASWNPSQDMQSIFRVYRFGQDKPCYIYRLIARGTMEEKILRRQITKLSLSSRVVDEHQIERHFKFDDVNEMYRYDGDDDTSKETLAVPKDRLLADLLISHSDWIRSYEQFDSLLENKPDEGLTNEEKEIAWEEYRQESERQKQFTSNNNNEANDTFLKVRQRLIDRNPNATGLQIYDATRIAVIVIERIRQLMLIQNQLTPEQRQLPDPLLDPLKAWLQQALTPLPPGTPPPPAGLDPILPPLPYGLQSAPNHMVPSGPSIIRPPRVRTTHQYAPRQYLPRQNYGQEALQRVVQNRFQHIASNAVSSGQQWNPIRPPTVSALIEQQRMHQGVSGSRDPLS